MAIRSGAIAVAIVLAALAGGCARRPAIEPSGANAEGGAATPSIRFEDDPAEPTFGTVAVEGLSSETLERIGEQARDRSAWVELFSVHTEDGIAADRPSVLGDYVVEERALRFRPRFPFVSSMTYLARVRGQLLDDWSRAAPGTFDDLELAFRLPEPETGAATRVEAVYPSLERVPENLLRLYIHFSAPINPKDVQRFVHLYDASGREVAMPFVEVEHGLWDPSNRRLTMFLHPGRIKRGVAPNMEFGPPLVEGLTYRLVVDRELRDAAGQPLTEGFVRELRVGPADRVSPVPGDWQVARPGSSDRPLRLDFPEPLDRSLLARWIAVVGPGGEPVQGTVVISRAETRWEFTPTSPWESGDYAILVNPALEDLAGNTLAHLFDEDPDVSSFSGESDAAAVELRFRVP